MGPIAKMGYNNPFGRLVPTWSNNQSVACAQPLHDVRSSPAHLHWQVQRALMAPFDLLNFMLLEF